MARSHGHIIRQRITTTVCRNKHGKSGGRFRSCPKLGGRMLKGVRTA